MKNRILYYIAILAPAGALALSWEILPSTLALVLLGFYVFIYRNFLDGLRLAEKGVIAKNEIWKMIKPGMRGKYFKELYLEK